MSNKRGNAAAWAIVTVSGVLIALLALVLASGLRQGPRTEPAEPEPLPNVEENTEEDAEPQPDPEEEYMRATIGPLDDGEIGDMNSNARKIHSVMKAAGAPDTNIAAMLSCIEMECNIDPTAIEAILDEPFQIGEKKSSAIADIPKFTDTRMVKSYGGWDKLYEPGYVGTDGRHWCGIGIGSSTGPACEELIYEANRAKIPWYSTGLQLAVMMAYGGAAGPTKMDEFVTAQYADTMEASEAFMRDYEGQPNRAVDGNATAEKWLARIKGWEPDQEYGRRFLDMSRQIRTDSNNR